MSTPSKGKYLQSPRKKWDETEKKQDGPKHPIPIGPRYQVDVPDWTGVASEYSSTSGSSEPHNSKWVQNNIWPIEDKSNEGGDDLIGKGRPESCACRSPGSKECVQRHIDEKKNQLQYELGPAFFIWQFDRIGEAASRFWDHLEQRAFGSLVKSNPKSQGEGFLERAVNHYSDKNKRLTDIVSYYYNVYVLRRISMLVRTGSKAIDSDDDEATAFKASRRRPRDDNGSTSQSSKSNSKYLRMTRN